VNYKEAAVWCLLLNFEGRWSWLKYSYRIVDLKRQHRLKVGTNKPELKFKMQSVSDDDIRKSLLEKPRFELAQKVYSDLEDVTSSGRAFQVFVPATGKARLPMVDSLTDGTRRLP